jgi:hypothetical protein
MLGAGAARGCACGAHEPQHLVGYGRVDLWCGSGGGLQLQLLSPGGWGQPARRGRTHASRSQQGGAPGGAWQRRLPLQTPLVCLPLLLLLLELLVELLLRLLLMLLLRLLLVVHARTRCRSVNTARRPALRSAVDR